MLVRDLVPGAGGSTPRDFVAFASSNDDVAFVADGPSTVGTELWITDGTTVGTRLLDLAPGVSSSAPTQLVADGAGRLFFSATTPQAGTEIWVSDGTSAGTVMLDYTPGARSTIPAAIRANGGLAFFGAGTSLHRSDGTLAGTFAVSPASTFLQIVTDALVVPTNRAYFRGESVADGSEVWISDGTIAGTRLFADLDPTSPTAGSSPVLLTTVAGRALLTASLGAGSSRAVLASDGTALGTVPLIASSGPMTPLATAGGFALLREQSSQPVFVVTDATPEGTRRLTVAVPPAIARANGAVALDGRVLISAARPGASSTNPELWITNGTDAGTTLVRDIHPTAGSNPFGMVRVGRRAFFVAEDGVTGAELWQTDGTTAGTAIVLDIQPPGSTATVRVLGAIGDRAIFAADDGVAGYELWSSDGSAAGTRLLADLSPGPAPTSFATAVDTGQRVVFVANTAGSNAAVFSTDGQTVVRLSIQTGLGLSYRGLASVGQRALVVAGFHSQTTPEAFITDGTAAGTARLVVALPRGEPVGVSSISTEHAVFFVTDGVTPARLYLVEDAAARVVSLGTVSLPLGIQVAPMLAGGDLLFPATDPLHGLELWHLSPGATAQREGLGCGAGILDLSANAPRVGRSVTFTLSGAAQVSALVLGTPPVTPTPLPISIVGCTVYVDAARPLSWLPLPSGANTLSLPIPLSFSLLRARLMTQAITGPTATGVDFSNGLRLTIDA